MRDPHDEMEFDELGTGFVFELDCDGLGTGFVFELDCDEMIDYDGFDDPESR